MDAQSLFNRNALDRLVLKLASDPERGGLRAVRSLSDVGRTPARLQTALVSSSAPEAAAPRRRHRRESPAASGQLPPRPLTRKPQRLRPTGTQQPASAEAEASELTALLRCGNYSICVVRSEELDDRSRGAHGAARRPASAPARDRPPPPPPTTTKPRERRAVSWHAKLTGAAAPQRSVSSSTARSDAYDPPPASPPRADAGWLAAPYLNDDSSDDALSAAESDSVLADDELTDVPRSVSAPELARSHSSSSSRSRSRRRGGEDELDERRLGSRGGVLVSRPASASSTNTQLSYSSRSSSNSTSRSRRRSREKSRSRSSSSAVRKTRAIRRWVAAEDTENQPVGGAPFQKKLGVAGLPPRPAGPPPVRSSSEIRSRAVAEVMLAMR